MNSIRIVAVYNYQIKNNIYQKYPNVTPCLHFPLRWVNRILLVNFLKSWFDQLPNSIC